MPPNMSFWLTTEQMRDRSKTVTRRLGWWNLRPGDTVMAVVKGMGLKKGQKVERIHPIRIVSARPEPLNSVTPSECVREGFPELSPEDFIYMFCRANKCKPEQTVNRISFFHLLA